MLLVDSIQTLMVKRYVKNKFQLHYIDLLINKTKHVLEALFEVLGKLRRSIYTKMY